MKRPFRANSLWFAPKWQLPLSFEPHLWKIKQAAAADTFYIMLKKLDVLSDQPQRKALNKLALKWPCFRMILRRDMFLPEHHYKSSWAKLRMHKTLYLGSTKLLNNSKTERKGHTLICIPRWWHPCNACRIKGCMPYEKQTTAQPKIIWQVCHSYA